MAGRLSVAHRPPTRDETTTRVICALEVRRGDWAAGIGSLNLVIPYGPDLQKHARLPDQSSWTGCLSRTSIEDRADRLEWTMKLLTNRELAVLRAIERGYDAGFTPTFPEIAAQLKVSKTRIAQLCTSLRAQGFITWENGRPRTLRLLQRSIKLFQWIPLEAHPTR